MSLITLEWTPMPAGEHWQEVRVYENDVAQAAAIPPKNSVTFRATPGTHVYTIRSWDGMLESDDSNSVTIIHSPPATPGHLKVS